MGKAFLTSERKSGTMTILLKQRSQLDSGSRELNKFARDLDGKSQLFNRGLRYFLYAELHNTRLRRSDNALLALVNFALLDPQLDRSALRQQIRLCGNGNKAHIVKVIQTEPAEVGKYVRDRLDEKWLRLQMLDMLGATGEANVPSR